MKLLTKLLFTLLLLCFAPAVLAQDACPSIVGTALDATKNACDATGRNQVCYGNVLLTAVPQAGAAAFTFAKPGDKADVGGVQSLTLSTMNTSDQQWGVALMKLQANLPDTLPGQNVTVVLFGDVAIQNEGTSATAPTPTVAPSPTPTPVLIGVTPSNKINVRSQPSTSGSLVTSIPKGETLQADGRTEAGDWLHVELDGGEYGWVFAQLVKADSDVSVLPVMTGDEASNAEATPPEAAAPVFGPMQAFYFTSGANDAPCAQAPDSGILIQTPEGAGTINLDVNNVSIQLGSTAYLQAQKSGNMTVSVIEGQGVVTVQGVTVTVPAGSQVTIPLDANGLASGAPVGPLPYNNTKLAPLPISLLERSITVALALTPDQIQALTAQLAYQDQNKNWHAVACFTDGFSFPAALNTLNYYGTWKAESGVTVAVTVPGDTSTDQGDAIHYSKIAFYSLPSTNPNDPPFAYSGNNATLSYTFAEETTFFLAIRAAPGDQPIVTVTC